MATLPRTPTANTEMCSTSAKTADGDGFSGLREAVTALRVGTASSPKTQSPNASAIRVTECTDSGYASKNPSQRGTPDSTPDASAKSVFVDGVMVQRWNLLGPKKSKLQLFDDIPKSQPTQERFNNLKSQYTKPLFEFLGKPPKPIKNIRNIAMTLEVLGKERETAAPWVLIQCRKSIAKKVRSFFKQSNVEADFKPSEPTLYAPYLPILVHEESPESVARSDNLSDPSPSEDASTFIGVAIYGDQFSMVETLCGSEIKAEIHKTIHTATIGGLVSVVNKDGNKSLFALTAGHFIDVDQYDEDEEDEEEDDDDAYSSDDEDPYELDLISLSNKLLSTKQDSSNKKPDELEQHKQLPWFGSEIGHIYRASQDDLQDRPNLDWALIAIESDSLYLPNVIMSNEVALPSPGLTRIGPKRKVTIAAARGRVLSGFLSQEWSYLTLAPGNTMVRSYLLTFNNGQVLNKGDSGAWVIDNETHEVYGHIVASEAFGRAHVIPMNDIFSDITMRLSLSAVGLASQDDILSVLSIEARVDKFSTPLGLKAVDSSSTTSDKTFPKSNNPISATSTNLKEPAEGTQFRSDPQSPPALPYSHLPQPFSALPSISHEGLEVDEGSVSQRPSREATSVTTPPLNYLTAPAPFYPDTNPGTHYNRAFTPQMSRPYPGRNVGQGPEACNAYRYSYRPPAYNLYPGVAQSYNPYALGYNPYTSGYNSYAPSAPNFNPIAPSFNPYGHSSPHKSGTDSGYVSTNSSPLPDPGPYVPVSPAVPISSHSPDLSRTYPGVVTQSDFPSFTTTTSSYYSKRSGRDSGYASQSSSRGTQ